MSGRFGNQPENGKQRTKPISTSMTVLYLLPDNPAINPAAEFNIPILLVVFDPDDSEAARKLGKPNIKDPEPVDKDQWIDDKDYPKSAIKNRVEGRLRVLLSITPKGRVDQCKIAHSTGSSQLDGLGCRLIMKRARFDPALNGLGQPTRSWYYFSMRWDVF